MVKKAANVFQIPLFEKRMDTSPHEKSPFFLNVNFLVNKISKTYIKFYMKKGMLHIYRTILRMSVFLGYLVNFRGIQVSRCFEAFV